MRRMGSVAVSGAVSIIVALAFVLPTSQGAVPLPGIPLGQVVAERITIDGRPALRLRNGRIIFLVPPTEAELYRRMTPMAPLAHPDPVARCLRDRTAPAQVDHRRFSVFPSRHQGGRSTCVTFATLGAIEARYRRRGVEIDLSEQFGNHIQKMTHLTERLPGTATLRENQLGAWGGSHTHYMVALMTYYRLPEERVLPYIADASFENTWEPADSPRIDWRDATVTQRQINDVNLTRANLPQASLEGARFGITRYRLLSAGEETVATYECILAAGYEIVFMFYGGSHAMLMIGYDRSAGVFLVRDSYGNDAPLQITYDEIERDADGSAYVIAVEENPDGNYRLAHMLLGRWTLVHDGWEGTLDINRFPMFFDRAAIGGQDDRRLGTYFDRDGRAFRVNGTIDRHRIDFYIDWESPNLPYGTLRGAQFKGLLFTRERTTLAGLLQGTDGQTYGFYATKGDRLRGQAAPGDRVTFDSYAGTWAMSHDGWRGTLTIGNVGSDGRFTGTYIGHDGRSLSVSGAVDASNRRRIQFTIPFEPASPQAFTGYLFSWERGMMSGHTLWRGVPFGFVASRQ